MTPSNNLINELARERYERQIELVEANAKQQTENTQKYDKIGGFCFFSCNMSCL